MCGRSLSSPLDFNRQTSTGRQRSCCACWGCVQGHICFLPHNGLYDLRDSATGALVWECPPTISKPQPCPTCVLLSLSVDIRMSLGPNIVRANTMGKSRHTGMLGPYFAGPCQRAWQCHIYTHKIIVEYRASRISTSPHVKFMKVKGTPLHGRSNGLAGVGMAT